MRACLRYLVSDDEVISSSFWRGSGELFRFGFDCARLALLARCLSVRATGLIACFAARDKLNRMERHDIYKAHYNSDLIAAGSDGNATLEIPDLEALDLCGLFEASYRSEARVMT